MIGKLEYSEKLNGLGIQSFLILPVQRIPRYVLLIQDLMKYTEKTHADYAMLEKALGAVKELADYINMNKSIFDESAKVGQIAAKITDYPKKEEPLLQPKRLFVREGAMTLKKDKLHVFLFNDILLFTKAKGKEKDRKYAFKGSIKLITACITNTTSDENSASFDIMSPSGSFKFVIESADKDLWLKDINLCIEKSKQDMLNVALGGRMDQPRAEGSKMFKQLELEKNLQKRHDSIKKLVESEKEYRILLSKIKTAFYEPIVCFAKDQDTEVDESAAESKKEGDEDLEEESEGKGSQIALSPSSSSLRQSLPSNDTEVVITQKLVNDIFINCGELLVLHTTISDSLEERLQSWTESSQIADIFSDNKEQVFKLYSDYVSGQLNSKQTFELCTGSNPQFASLISELETKEQPLQEFLAVPVRKLSTYYLLLQEFYQHTESSNPEYAQIKAVVDEIRQRNEEMDQAKMAELKRAKANAVPPQLLRKGTEGIFARKARSQTTKNKN
eukprot:TRINITY_DN2706_c0_g1_i1.p1 TRINITY_DN2706_c0_g1~~TRINITY_DN2706_c0_g1_i1.p1  ORF type:complete len:503 (-),score=185.71 TRINITY_DN2706_c0_g1_i1:25-1533(-)